MKLSDLQRQVAAATIYHVAQWDPALCEQLAQQKWERITNPKPILKALAHKHGWDPSSSPASWFAGSADYFGNEERNHSGYYGIRDPDREIERRLLCAQMSVLLPLIEERRPFLIRDLAPLLGKSYTDPEGRQIATEQMEITHIAHVLNRDGHSSAEVQILAAMRRRLAHITKVEVSEIERLEELFASSGYSIGPRRPHEPRSEDP